MRVFLLLFSTSFLGCSSDKDPSSTDREDSGDGPVDDTGLVWESHFPARECGTVFSLESSGAAQVFLAGDFNAWSSTATPMTEEGGVFSVSLSLDPGSYAYKFVEKDGDSSWRCDPEASLFQCDPDYDASAWKDCSAGANSCNSLKVVEDCALPRLHILSFELDSVQGLATLAVGFEPGNEGRRLETLSLGLDDIPQPVAWDGGGVLHLPFEDLEAGRHHISVVATDEAGLSTNDLHLPFWTDGSQWSDGLLYYAFADRFHNGDSTNDEVEGTISSATDYQGGDWAGVEAKLDSLHSLGVRSLWLTAPIDNAEGAWGDDCGTDYSAYHGYWPTSATEFEAHFGGEAAFSSLVSAAHARGMRIIVDWVGNHVHEDHPYREEHPGWFAETPLLCDDADHWNTHPETCWFDSFLPDVNYFQAEPLLQMVDDAVGFAKKHNLDGYRVDAVKHMPRPVYSNLQAGIAKEIEHPGSGFDFYTVGETFDGDRGLISSYVGDDMLDAQFDFPLYFSLRSAMLGWGTSLEELEASFEASREAYGDALMSTFLGNHDVERFVTQAAEGSHGECDSSGNFWSPAQPPSGSDAYARLRMAWTWLLSRPGLPLVYYGDEIGLPGYFDPDNRQVMRFGEALLEEEAKTREHVAILGQARLENAALSSTASQLWWTEPSVTARLSERDGAWALSIVNAGSAQRELSNSLAWAGMPEGQWRDVLTGQTHTAENDQLALQVGALSSALLVFEGP